MTVVEQKTQEIINTTIQENAIIQEQNRQQKIIDEQSKNIQNFINQQVKANVEAFNLDVQRLFIAADIVEKISKSSSGNDELYKSSQDLAMKIINKLNKIFNPLIESENSQQVKESEQNA
jgi:hypothetical protein